jgi:hypothetical protein
MTSHQPRLSQGVPMTPISPGDLAVIAEMLKGYLTFVRLAYRPSAHRDAYMQYIESLRERLAGQHRENTPIQLTLEDIETIEAAMSTFEVITMQMAPPTRERDATIHGCACLRQQIARMRSDSSSSSRRSLN